MSAMNYEFLNELMQDPSMAAVFRKKEIGQQASGYNYQPDGTPDVPEPVPNYKMGGPPEQLDPIDDTEGPGNPAMAGPYAPANPAMDEGGSMPPDVPPILPGMTGPPPPPKPFVPPVAPMAAMQPKKPGWLRSHLPVLLEGAMAGGATENHARGGGSDIMRAMQAGGGVAKAHELEDYSRGRQAQLDEIARKKVEAEIGMDAAHSRYYDSDVKLRTAQANVKGAVTPEQDLYNKWDKEKDPDKKKAAWADLESYKHGIPKEQFPLRKMGPGVMADHLGNLITIDPAAKMEAEMAARVNMTRDSLGRDPKLWTDIMMKKFSTPAQREFWTTGAHAPAVPHDSMVDLARGAATGNKDDAAALKLLKPGPDPLAAALAQERYEAASAKRTDDINRERATALSHADQFYESATRSYFHDHPSEQRQETEHPGTVAAVQPAAQKMRQMQQNAYSNYSAAIRARGGQADDFVVTDKGEVVTKASIAAAGLTPKATGTVLPPKQKGYLDQQLSTWGKTQ